MGKKVVITSEGTTLDSAVDPRFGRCRTFLVVDVESLDVEAVPNTAAMQGGGAGIQAAQMVSSRGVEAVITGNMGPNAARVLEAANIPVYVGASGTAKEALEAYRSGGLRRTQGSTVGAHYGMGGGGMGGRMGRGMGPGGVVQGGEGSGGSTGSLDELKRLKKDLQSRMDDIEKRIEELEKK